MRYSLGLPVDRVDQAEEFGTGPAVVEMSRAAEAAGFDAVFVTDHPAPDARWLAHGGHHALEPMVALSFAAAATTTLRVHTNLYVPAYRSPLLAAKSLASLDALSGGRLIVGLGSGYLRPEFDALGVPFEGRGALLDEAIEVMVRAWTGEPVALVGERVRAEAAVIRPTPVQRPHPPLWVGGNSTAALRRAVARAQGWSPFANAGFARATRTAEIASLDDLAARLALARDLAVRHGRTEPLEVCFTPLHLVAAGSAFEAAAVLEEAGRLGDLGVGWSTVQFDARTRAEWLAHVERFSAEVLRAG